jgi:4-hydroxythreonine-4-phosphate dehydrogenase
MLPIIAVTMGDPGGVGPEVIVKSLKKLKPSQKCAYVVIGARSAFDLLKKKCGLSFSFKFITEIKQATLKKGKTYFLDITPSPTLSRKQERYSSFFSLSLRERGGVRDFKIGKVDSSNALLAHLSLQAALDAANKGWVHAIVTAPLNKTTMRLIDPKFRGHTEFLAEGSNTKEFAMMFVSDRLKVTLVTIHVALRDVSRLIKRKIVFEKIRLTHDFLKKYFRIASPKLAVCALNPHGKETGEEDEREIAPAVNLARKKKIHATGPLSADQLFHDAYEGRYDAVISMYHDQGLAPFKMIAFQDGVNVTLGLPFIRTSPDHGTAFDIAYQGNADEESMLSALKLAQKLVVNG